MNKGDQFSQVFDLNLKIYQGFIEVFKDKNPLHTDIEFARSKGFNGLVMHGNILNGFVSYFVGEMLPIKNVIIHSQKIRFFLPVYLNETVEFNAEIVDIFYSVNIYQFKFYFQNTANKKVASGEVQIGML